MRAIALSVALALAAAAQITPRFNEVVAAMAAALAENNAHAFLAHIDPSMRDFEKLKANVEALTNQAEVHSGIESVREDGPELELDWALDITARGNTAQKEKRRSAVYLKFEKRGGEWKVVALKPVDLFAPPAVP